MIYRNFVLATLSFIVVILISPEVQAARWHQVESSDVVHFRVKKGTLRIACINQDLVLTRKSSNRGIIYRVLRLRDFIRNGFPRARATLKFERLTERCLDESGAPPIATPTPTPTGTVAPNLTATIEQHGVQFQFANPVPYGTFANGDYWVVGPVTLTAISPDYTGTRHGFEINPSSINLQGFDSRAPSFDATLVPTLPLVVAPGSSVVKAISIDVNEATCRPCLQTAAVLTVLAESPPNGGSDFFRPGYFGSIKELHSTEHLKTELLPTLPQVAGAPSLETIASQYARVQLDHKTNWTGRYLHPSDNMPDYGSSISIRNSDAALRLMLDDSIESKRQAIINYVQHGLDVYYTLIQGGLWPANGGHTLGRLLPMAFAAVILDDQSIKDAVQNSTPQEFCENLTVYYSANAGRALYGQQPGGSGGGAYWTNLVLDTGSRTQRDPYGYIDGGYRPGSSYQYCCISMPYKATALAVELMPSIKSLWPNSHLLDYAKRWVEFGAWTQPDPCAPAEGSCSGGDNPGAACNTANELSTCTGGGTCTLSMDNYGVTFGDDGAGGCILDSNPSDGIGRFPNAHGSSANSGYYGSAFSNTMWDNYYPN